MSRLLYGGMARLQGFLSAAAFGHAASRRDRSSRTGGETACDPCARKGLAEALRPDRHERRADVEQILRMRRVLHAAHTDHGDLHARRGSGHLRERDGPDRRSGQAARAAAQPPPRRVDSGPSRSWEPASLPRAARGSPAPSARSPRRERHRSERVDQRHRVRPALLRGARTGGHVGCVGRQLHDQRLARMRAHRPHDRLQLAGIGADVKARVHVRARHVQLDRRDLHARVARLHAARRSPPRWNPSRS